MSFPTYSSMVFSEDGSAESHKMYWHRNPVPGEKCDDCNFFFAVKDTLMETVQAINPGMPALPDWVHQGAIMGVQGGTEEMLGYLQQVSKLVFMAALLSVLLCLLYTSDAADE